MMFTDLDRGFKSHNNKKRYKLSFTLIMMICTIESVYQGSRPLVEGLFVEFFLVWFRFR